MAQAVATRRGRDPPRPAVSRIDETSADPTSPARDEALTSWKGGLGNTLGWHREERTRHGAEGALAPVPRPVRLRVRPRPPRNTPRRARSGAARPDTAFPFGRMFIGSHFSQT